MTNTNAASEANAVRVVNEEDLIMNHPELKVFTETLSNQIAGQVMLATRAQQSIMGVGTYHVFSHPIDIFNKVAPSFVEVETIDPLGIKAAYDNYNEQQETELKLPDFKEMYGIIKFCILVHDLGNGFTLNPKIKEILNKGLDILQFKKEVELLNLEFNEYLIPLKEHTETGAEERSKEIGSFYLKYTVGVNSIATKDSGEFSNIYPDEYVKKVERFIHLFCEHTKFFPGENLEIPFATVVKIMDRVLPYIGMSLDEKLELIRRLAQEKVEDMIKSKISLLTALNFPILELVRVGGDANALKLLNYFKRNGLENPLGKFVKSTEFTQAEYAAVGEAVSWEQLLKLLNNRDIINLIREKY